MRIVLVNQVPSRPLLEVAEALAERGHDVTLIAAASSPPGPTTRVGRVRLSEYDSHSTFKRIRSWLTFTLQAVWALSTMPAPNTIVVCTNPPIMPHAAVLVAWIRGCRCVARVLDIYPDVLQATGFRHRKVLVRFLAWCNRWAYARCQAICTLGEMMAETLAAYVARPKIRVIPEWPAGSGARPNAVAPSTVGPFVVLATGNVGLTHDIEPLIDASRRLVGDNVQFIVSTSDPAKLSACFSDCTNVRVMPRLDDVEYARAMQAAHAAFVSLKPGAEAASYPSRVLAYIAHGLPIIAVTARPSDLASIVEAGPCGVVVSPDGGGLEVAAAIRMLRSSPDVWQAMADSARAAAEAMSTDRCRDELVRLIEKGSPE